MKNHTPTFVILTLLLIAFRCLFNGTDQLVLVNGLLNSVALLFVFFSITEQIIEAIHSRIDTVPLPKDIAVREKKSKKIATYIISYLVYAIIVFVYLRFFISELGNDILSIISLGLSLIDRNISNCIANNIKL